jgi:oligopeptide transport system permease protein
VTRFLLRRLGWFVLTCWAVMTLSFFLMRATPGGPFSSERRLNAAVEENIRARYHLDWPVWKQYLNYVGPLNLDEHGAFGSGRRTFGGVLAGDLGPSFAYRDLSVNDIIAQSFPISVLLGLVALVVAITVGVGAGTLSAMRPGRVLDHTLRLVSTAGIALPNFVIAGILILLFVFTIPVFPVAGWGTPMHMVLPGIALGLPFAAYIARLTRTGMLEALSAPHIRTAVAKGLPRWRIVSRHALRAGILPVVSYLGPTAAGILTGSLVIETIFYIPGTGSHFVNGALNRDYTLAMGVTLLYTILVYVLNTVVDLAYGLLDPRVELEKQ